MTSDSLRLDTIERAIADIKAGKPVVVIDDEDRENEGDLIFAAELATPEMVAFMVRYTSGYICVPITEAEADRLDLPPMFRVNQDRRGTAYTVTVDAREGVSTGISASDRATTIRLLADQVGLEEHLRASESLVAVTVARIGNSTVNAVPFPAPALSALTVPPCASTR